MPTSTFGTPNHQLTTLLCRTLDDQNLCLSLKKSPHHTRMKVTGVLQLSSRIRTFGFFKGGRPRLPRQKPASLVCKMQRVSPCFVIRLSTEEDPASPKSAGFECSTLHTQDPCWMPSATGFFKRARLLRLPAGFWGPCSW